MVRSLSLYHVFVILAVSYIGGAILFRIIDVHDTETVLQFVDRRVVDRDSSVIWSLMMMGIFLISAYALSIKRQTRFFVLLIGALKGVLFGLSSSYLLAEGTGMVDYSIWWFPFQFVFCFLLLLYCSVLGPPYFDRMSQRRKKRNLRPLPFLLACFTCLQLMEVIVFHIFVK